MQVETLPYMVMNIKKLQQSLDYEFSDLELAKLALTHRSADKINYERLEFLGDSLLGYVVAENLFENFPKATEGELSRMRSTLVNKATLADIARELNLGNFLRLGSGENKSGGSDRDSILADVVEALIAAIYLDAGLQKCRKVVNVWMDQQLSKNAVERQSKDAKTQLQELMQASGLELPEYSILRIEGKAHEQIFYVECRIKGVTQAQTSSGASKRNAEQGAAKKMLHELEGQH